MTGMPVVVDSDNCVDGSKMAGSHAQQSVYKESLYLRLNYLFNISH